VTGGLTLLADTVRQFGGHFLAADCVGFWRHTGHHHRSSKGWCHQCPPPVLDVNFGH